MLETLFLDQTIDRIQLSWGKDFRIIEQFVSQVKVHLVLDKYFFNFFEVPQFLVVQKYKKTEFKLLKDFLLQV